MNLSKASALFTKSKEVRVMARFPRRSTGSLREAQSKARLSLRIRGDVPQVAYVSVWLRCFAENCKALQDAGSPQRAICGTLGIREASAAAILNSIHRYTRMTN